jgi:tripartite-type tricarboxylate transporter receptor subunit TctC
MQQSFRTVGLVLALVAGATLFGGLRAAADDFYKGKTVTIYVGFGPGGGYDIAARILQRHLAAHLPGNPTVIVANKPGASGMTLLNFLYSVAPNDGTVFGTFHSASPFYEAIGMEGVRYKSAELSWIGNVNRSANVIAVWHDTGVHTIEDATHKPIVMGALAGAGIMNIYPRVMNAIFGTKFQIVDGYEGTNDVNLAIERGEVQGATTAWNSWKVARPEWVAAHKIVPIVQIGLQKDPSLPEVPLLIDLAKTDDQRQLFRAISGNIAIERPFAGPPRIPPDRLDMLRRAFDHTVADPAFLEDAARIQADVDPQSGEEVTRIVQSVVSTPADVIRELKRDAGVK